MKKQFKILLLTLLIAFIISLIAGLVLSVAFGYKYWFEYRFPEGVDPVKSQVNPFFYLGYGFAYIVINEFPGYELARAGAVFMYILMPLFGGIFMLCFFSLLYRLLNQKSLPIAQECQVKATASSEVALGAETKQVIADLKTQFNELQPYLIGLHKQIKKLNVEVFGMPSTLIEQQTSDNAEQALLEAPEHTIEQVDEYQSGDDRELNLTTVVAQQQVDNILAEGKVNAKERLGFHYMQPEINPKNYIRPNHNSDAQTADEDRIKEERVINDLTRKDEMIRKANNGYDKTFASNSIKQNNFEKSNALKDEFTPTESGASKTADLMKNFHLAAEKSDNRLAQYVEGDSIQYEGQEWYILEINKTYVSNIRMYNLKIKNTLNGYIKDIMLQNITKLSKK